MAMITFEDLPSTNTPLNAANLNNNFSEILNLVCPVGKVEVFFDNNDHSNYLGFTWERTCVGRTPVGIDTTQTEFDTIGETGGSKTDDLSNAYALVGRSTTTLGSISYKSTGGRSEQHNRTLLGGGGIDGNTVTAQDNSALGGSVSTLQPYQVVAYWKRTA